MRIPARLKRYVDLQSLIALIACHAALYHVLRLYPDLFPKYEHIIRDSWSFWWTGFISTSCIILYDLKNSGNGFWTFDRTILATMIMYVIMDTATLVLFSLPIWLHIDDINDVYMFGMGGHGLANALRYSPQRAPFNLLTGLFCGVTIALVNRTILACSRFIVRRKGMAS